MIFYFILFLLAVLAAITIEVIYLNRTEKVIKEKELEVNQLFNIAEDIFYGRAIRK